MLSHRWQVDLQLPVASTCGESMSIHSRRNWLCDMTYCLVLEDGCEVANDVDHAKYETVLRTHSEVRSVCITSDRLCFSHFCEEVVHGTEAADLVARRVYSVHEHEDDCKENSSMGAGPCSEYVQFARVADELTSRKVMLPAFRRLRHR